MDLFFSNSEISEMEALKIRGGYAAADAQHFGTCHHDLCFHADCSHDSCTFGQCGCTVGVWTSQECAG